MTFEIRGYGDGTFDFECRFCGVAHFGMKLEGLLEYAVENHSHIGSMRRAAQGIEPINPEIGQM